MIPKHRQNPVTHFFIWIPLFMTFCACNFGIEKSDNVLKSEPIISNPFPDSTNLKNSFDSLTFATDCMIDHNRDDIAERYFKSLIKNWDKSEECNTIISDSFGWLSAIEREKTPMDTNLVFEYLNCAQQACPKLGRSYFMHGNVLMEFGLDSVEHYFNISVEKGEDIGYVSECINVNIDKIDTNKLNFEWLRFPALQDSQSPDPNNKHE